MAFFKSPEDRAKARAEAEEAKKRARAKAHEARVAAKKRQEVERYEKSPEGRAVRAFERGDHLFQVVLTVDDDSARALSEIEKVGWRLDNAGYAYPVDVSTSSNDRDQVSSVYVSGSLTGVYLFRRP